MPFQPAEHHSELGIENVLNGGWPLLGLAAQALRLEAAEEKAGHGTFGPAGRDRCTDFMDAVPVQRPSTAL